MKTAGIRALGIAEVFGAGRANTGGMKLLIEILLSIFLHPIAMVLMWINLIARGDLQGWKKVVWFIVSIVWGLGPILYVLVADGALW
jgi:hypothetical protein